MAVSKRLRYEVLRRDNYTCRYCGAKAPDVQITVDHVIPQALGGTDEPSNLCAACGDCNNGKSSMGAGAAVVADVAEDALRWSRAMAVAAQEMHARLEREHDLLDRFDDCWMSELGIWADRPEDWAASIRMLLAAGLSIEILEECVSIARDSRASGYHKWRYMCGTAWRKAKELRARASAIVDFSPDDGDGPDLTDTELQARSGLARELLGEIPPVDREYALACYSGAFGEDDPGLAVCAVTAAVASVVRDRTQLAEAVRWFLDQRADGMALREQVRAYLEAQDSYSSPIEILRITALCTMGAVNLPAGVA